MISQLPLVRHAGLQHRRGAGNPALHLHFECPLETVHQAIILGELGTHALRPDGHVFSPEFRGEIVLLRPTPGEKRLDEAAFQAAARHFGFVSPDGDLPFIGQGQCPPEDSDDESGVVARMPLLRQ